MNKDTVIGVIINIIFVVGLVTTRYYYAKKEMNFLKGDSTRQDELITINKTKIDTLYGEVDSLYKLNSKKDLEINNLNKENKDRIAEKDSLKKVLRKELLMIKTQIDSFQTSLSSAYLQGTIPFEQEFGTQDAYVRVFGRSGFRVEGHKLKEYKTILEYDGSIALAEPTIKRLSKNSFQAIINDMEVGGLRIKGSESALVKLKMPRNQISLGPIFGITYDKVTGLTSPVWGFGLSYNLINLANWK
jgi:hypothetical protein|tara:strand:+ start:7846 stop:8580 length:735 start_codon:yes stop_codon:yes gene_type:complete